MDMFFEVGQDFANGEKSRRAHLYKLRLCASCHPAGIKQDPRLPSGKHFQGLGAAVIMAIFHFSVKMVSRGKGQSSVAKAAYNAREKLENGKTGEVHDYTRAEGLAFSGIFAPKDAPDWARDREKLWSEVERVENRINSQLAREVQIALPSELTEEQRRHLITDFVRENFVRHGLAADVAIHLPDREGDDRNHHAHVLLTTRALGPDGFGPKLREMNSKAQLETWRENWARTANRYLERYGHEARIDHRSLEAQGIDREPTTHKGPTATQMEREGEPSERGDINRDIEARNKERERLQIEARAVGLELTDAERVTEPRKTAGREALKELIGEEDKRRQEEHEATTSLEKSYDRGGMVSQQQAATRHHEQRQKSFDDAAALKRREAEAIKRLEAKGKQQRGHETKQQEEQKKRDQNSVAGRKDQGEQKREERTARTEQTEAKQREAQKNAMQEIFERSFGKGHNANTLERWGRERERER